MNFEEAFASGLTEVLEHKEGVRKLDSVSICVPVVNPRDIRSRLEISQRDFADRFGIPLSTVRNWEQGARSPDQPTSILLHLINKFPDQIAGEIRKLKAH